MNPIEFANILSLLFTNLYLFSAIHSILNFSILLIKIIPFCKSKFFYTYKVKFILKINSKSHPLGWLLFFKKQKIPIFGDDVEKLKPRALLVGM